MDEDEESTQEASLALYKTQLTQVDQALAASGPSPDLTQLKGDLEELISLTKDTLLGIKKAKLLRAMGMSQDVEETANTSVTKVDDEYAAFQAALSQDNPSSSTSKNDSCHLSNSLNHEPAVAREESEESDDDQDYQVQEYLSKLVGTKCRAPFSHEWGGLHYGNAMILSVDAPEDGHSSLQDHKVRVIFVNPVHQSLVPCKFYMDSNCRFSDDTCRSSHGHLVSVSQLQAYIEPDHSKLREGCRCLAKFDEVWYPGTVTDVCGDEYLLIKWAAGGKEEEPVLIQNVIPIDEDADESSDDSSDSDSDNGDKASSSHSNKKNKKLLHRDEKYNANTSRNVYMEGEDGNEVEVPVEYVDPVWKPLQTVERLGAWEDHTRGIGSRLMAKMGYIAGQGLGPNGDGRAIPVPIQLIPQGKLSLDKIMELKEMAGDADLFNAMKTLERRQKVMAKKAEDKVTRQASWGVFGFLNKELATVGKSAPGAPKVKQHPMKKAKDSDREVKQSSVRDLKKKSEQEVNVQIFRTSEEIRTVERDLIRLKSQLARNINKDKKMSDHVSNKIAQQEKYLSQLKTSSRVLDTHKDQKNAHKKLTVF